MQQSATRRGAWLGGLGAIGRRIRALQAMEPERGGSYPPGLTIINPIDLEEIMAVIDAVRDRYPVPSQEKTTDVYCVGGALCLYMGRPTRIPSVQELRDLLEEQFCRERPNLARAAAHVIIRLNDAAKFEAAWQAAAAAEAGDPARLYDLAVEHDLLDKLPTVVERFLSIMRWPV